MALSIRIRNLVPCALIAAGCVPLAAQTPIRPVNAAMPDAKLASIPDFTLPERYKDRKAHPLPPTVDNTKSSFFPSYAWGQQGNSCGSAHALSYVYGYEAQLQRKLASSGKTPEYSYQYAYHFLNGGDMAEGGDGWNFVEAFDILKATGAPTSADFGGLEWGNAYGGWMSGYDKYHRAMKYRASEYYKIDASKPASDELIKQYLHDHGDGSPAGGLLVFQARSKGWQIKTVNGRRIFASFEKGGHHALSIVGYDDTFNGGSYLVANSWGDGFYWMAYSLLRAGGNLATAQGTPVMFCRLKQDYAPRLTFKITLTHDQRDKIAIVTGMANSADAAAPAFRKDYAGAFNFSGGPYPMAGRNQSATLEFGLDLTDFAPSLTGNEARFFLQVVSKGGTGRINSLALMDYTGATVRSIPLAGGETTLAPNATTTVSIPWSGTASALKGGIPSGGDGRPRIRQVGGGRFMLSGGRDGPGAIRILDLLGKEIHRGPPALPD